MTRKQKMANGVNKYPHSNLPFFFLTAPWLCPWRTGAYVPVWHLDMMNSKASNQRPDVVNDCSDPNLCSIRIILSLKWIPYILIQ